MTDIYKKAKSLYPLLIEEINEEIEERMPEHEIFPPDKYVPKGKYGVGIGVKKGAICVDFKFVQDAVNQIIDELKFEDRREKERVEEILEIKGMEFIRKKGWLCDKS